jgi:hypothetical protein
MRPEVKKQANKSKILEISAHKKEKLRTNPKNSPFPENQTHYTDKESHCED